MCEKREGPKMEKANIFIVFRPGSLVINCTLLKKEFIIVCDLTGFVILTANLKEDLRRPV